jgi:FtsH-binding integral membrane protein
MENQNFRGTNIDKIDYASVVTTSNLLRSVFAWMSVALVMTTIASMLFAFVPSLVQMLFTEAEGGGYKLSVLAWVVMFAPLGFVMLMSFGFNKLSYPALIAVFLAYAAVNGISLSFIFMVYSLGSIVNVFLSTVALFAIMAIAGYTTKTDLTKMGSLLMIGLFGIIIASVINIFMKSDTMGFITSILGVIIFTGLTAWDVQKIKNMAAEDDGSTPFKKMSIMGALTLYLDFINIFLYLLRLFGKRD